MAISKKTYLIAGIVLVLGAAGLWYYTATKKKEVTPPVPDTKPEPENKTATPPAQKSSEPFSKTDTAKVKIQPIQPLAESNADLLKKKVYANTGGAKVYSIIGTEAGKTTKGQFLGNIGKVEKMANGTYWIYFVNPSKKVFKIVSTVVDVEA
jgi:hypothetical protein